MRSMSHQRPRRTTVRRTLALVLGAVSLLLSGGSVLGQNDADPNIAFERYFLPNGLEVILHQDNRVPLAAVSVWYHVGSGDEVPGKSGFAHLFEHMMFQGSLNTGEDVHFALLKRAGASGVNGSTNPDRTNYYEVVPSNQLETALWLESDRMAYMLPLLGEDSLKNQRDVVRNERRQRYDNVPYGKSRFALHEALYAEGHPYRYMTIGRHEDIEAASVDDVVAFFNTWYVPANATLAIAGDIDIDETKQLVEKWFGSFPTSKRPTPRTVPPSPVRETKRVKVEDKLAKLERVEYAWHSPAFFAPGDAEMDILADVLGREGTGRLYRRLVHEEQLAQAVSVYQSSKKMSSVFHVAVLLKPGADMAEVERIIQTELDQVMKEPVTAREFQRAVTNFEARHVWGLESLLARTEQLQAYNHYTGKPDFITEDLDRYRKTTPERVRDVARRTLGKNNRVELVTVPAPTEAR